MLNRYDVFVSYSSRDAAIVSRVVNDLTKAGLTVWWDQSAIRPAERIREAINHGIQNSSTVLIFISSKSLESRWVLNELDAAMLKEISERKPLVFPVLIGRITSESLPDDLKGKKYIDLRHNFERRYALLRVYLITAIGSVAHPAHYERDNEYPIGDELARFFINYQPRTAREDVLEHFAYNLTDILRNLGAQGDEEDEVNEFRKEILNEYINDYGLYGLKKLTVFFLEQAGIDAGKPITNEMMVDLINEITSALMMFRVQKTFEEQMSGGVDINGKFFFRR